MLKPYRCFFRLILLALLNIVCTCTFAQQTIQELGPLLESLAAKRAPSLVYLQPSKVVYEKGEDLWFKGYLMDSRSLQPSKIDTTLYVQLIRSVGLKVVANALVPIRGGFAESSLVIVDTIPPGDYLLAGFTAGSIYLGDEDLKSFRKLKIVDRMASNLITTTRFNRLLNNEIELIVQVRNKKLQPVVDAKISVEVVVDNRPINIVKGITGTDGTAQILFSSLSHTAKLNIRTSHREGEILEQISIPFHSLKRIHLGLFPEGGNLVEAQVNTVAFKANDGRGNPLKINGALFEQGRRILEFKSIHDGMGKFEFQPLNGKEYSIKIDSIDSLYRLPKIHKVGMVLRMIRQNAKTASFLVTRNGQTSDSVVVSVQTKGSLLALYRSEFKNDTIRFTLSADKFPQGIVEVTLFSNQMVPIAERLVYFNLGKDLKIVTELLQEGYERRDSVRMLIKTINWKGDPVRAHLGLSVNEIHHFDQQDFLDIVSYSHLYSQVRGSIINPDYYFNVENADRVVFLDLLLITQGWRKYLWGETQLQEVKKSRSVISNAVLGKINSKVGLPPMLLAFSGLQKGLDYPIPVSLSAEFEIKMEHLMLARGGYLYIKPLGNEKVSKQAKLNFSNPFKDINQLIKEKSLTYPIIHRKIITDTLKYLPKLSGIISLNEVVINGSGKAPVFRDKFMASLDSLAKFSGNYDYVGKCNWLNCVSCGHGTRPLEGGIYPRFKSGISKVPRHYQSFTSQEIDKSPYTYPKYTDAELLEKYNIYRIQGYSAPKEFYEPNYSRHSENPLSDFRSALAWRPSIITDEDGEAIITFFCSDFTGKFLVNIEGIDSAGHLGKSQFSFVVRDNR